MGCSGLWVVVGCGRAVGCWLLAVAVAVVVGGGGGGGFVFVLVLFMFLSLLWFLFIHVVFVGHGWFSLVGGRGGWLVTDVFWLLIDWPWAFLDLS